jgi:hypothetical protein
MRKRILLSIALLVVPNLVRADLTMPANPVYGGWLQMYDLNFVAAHQTFLAWKQTHPQDPLGSASNAAAYLFAELARLGTLESELFVNDAVYKQYIKLQPDPKQGKLFVDEVASAERLADIALRKSSTDTNALFVKSITSGLRADYWGLVEKQPLTALGFTKQGRVWADKLLAADPKAYDAYLGPGLENYLLSLKPAPVRFFLRLTGSNTDRDKGVEEIRKTASGGYYLEPFAKMLLAVAALRDHQPANARQFLGELHRRFPDNELYVREMNRIPAGNQR